MADIIDVTPKKDKGVLKVIKKEGNGFTHPSPGSDVYVHYVGTLENGEKFDSSRDRGEQFKFTLAKQQVIKGWDLGVATMKMGEIAEFTIAAEYGYGAAGSPPKIPGGATLKFQIELFRWEAEDISPDRDGTITRDVIVRGEELANPNDTSEVEVHAVGKFQGRVFYDREVKFALGEGMEVDLPEGVDRALRRFGRGEKSTIHLKGSRFTYGSSAPAEFIIPVNASVDFTLFLKSYEKVPATWEMPTAEKFKAATAAKERGTEFLKAGKLRLAINKYKRVEDLLEYEKTANPEEKKERDTILLAAYLNLALAVSKMNEQLECVKFCDKALEVDPGNVKALYRKGNAKLAYNDIEQALKIFQQVVDTEPENKAAQQQVLVCKQKLKENEERDRKRFKGMFAKLAEENAQEEKAKEQKNPFEENAMECTINADTGDVSEV